MVINGKNSNPFLIQDLFQGRKIHGSFIKTIHPAGTPVRIQWDTHHRQVCFHAKTHATDQFDYTGNTQNAYTAMFPDQFPEHGFQAAPAPDIWIDIMIPQHIADLINVTCFQASPAYIVDFIGTGFTVCLGLL